MSKTKEGTGNELKRWVNKTLSPDQLDQQEEKLWLIIFSPPLHSIIHRSVTHNLLQLLSFSENFSTSVIKFIQLSELSPHARK